jgi:hypothetical protein
MEHIHDAVVMKIIAHCMARQKINRYNMLDNRGIAE